MFSIPTESKSRVRILWIFLFVSTILALMVAATALSIKPASSLLPLSLSIIFFIIPFSIKRVFYKVWSKVSARMSRLLRSYTLKILYYIVLPIISLAGTKMVLHEQREVTLWQTFGEKNGDEVVFEQSGNNWTTHYLSWAFKSKNFWIISLYPFVLLLKMTETANDNLSPETLLTYTLY